MRGCVVYDAKRLKQLKITLHKERPQKSKGGVPAKIKKQLSAKPEAFFSVKQTWASSERKDYVLVPILEDDLPFLTNKFWKITPNSGEVASSIAVSAAQSGLRVLIFSQSIRNAVSIAKRAENKHNSFKDCGIHLSKEEIRDYRIAVYEMGGADQLYLNIEDDRLVSCATVHHGLLLLEERRLVESLFRRKGALSIVVATPTLSQGMNLPAELVIIAEIYRFDEKSNRRDRLKAKDILNAAGRAGRAGQASTGVVLTIPGEVVGLEYNENTLGNNLNEISTIFEQSDQCLSLDDPLTALLDKIHDQRTKIGDHERYVFSVCQKTPYF